MVTFSLSSSPIPIVPDAFPCSGFTPFGKSTAWTGEVVIIKNNSERNSFLNIRRYYRRYGYQYTNSEEKRRNPLKLLPVPRIIITLDFNSIIQSFQDLRYIGELRQMWE